MEWRIPLPLTRNNNWGNQPPIPTSWGGLHYEWRRARSESYFFTSKKRQRYSTCAHYWCKIGYLQRLTFLCVCGGYRRFAYRLIREDRKPSCSIWISIDYILFSLGTCKKCGPDGPLRVKHTPIVYRKGRTEPIRYLNLIRKAIPLTARKFIVEMRRYGHLEVIAK